jgi:mycofactocin precursor
MGEAQHDPQHDPEQDLGQDQVVSAEELVEEVSIDGMCGVY